MPETFYRTGNYKGNHTTYGGIICFSDFNTNYTNGNIADRIANDKKFDEQCRKNILNKQNNGGIRKCRK